MDNNILRRWIYWHERIKSYGSVGNDTDKGWTWWIYGRGRFCEYYCVKNDISINYQFWYARVSSFTLNKISLLVWILTDYSNLNTQRSELWIAKELYLLVEGRFGHIWLKWNPCFDVNEIGRIIDIRVDGFSGIHINQSFSKRLDA